MKLDQTFIAIRERTTLEIFDLGLQVTRQHFARLFSLLLLGALPWMIINWVLLGWILNAKTIDESTFSFYWLMMVLVVSQSHMGTSMITYYLGQSMFIEELTVKQTVFESFWKSPFFWWLHGGLRLALPILGLVFLAWHGNESTLASVSVFATMLLLIAIIVRAARPFVTEIVLLEKTPVRVDDPSRVNFSRRTANLHRNAGGTLFHRFIVSCFFFPLLFLSVYSGFNLIDDAFALQPGFEFPLKSLYWLFALWLTVGFAAVVRFLSYIDIRIRQEGWAVELKMRAEGLRLTGGEAQ